MLVTVKTPEKLTTLFFGEQVLFTNPDTISNKWTLDRPTQVVVPPATRTLAVDSLDLIASATPVCANNISVSCPDVFSLIQNSSSVLDFGYFICGALPNASYPGLCL